MDEKNKACDCRFLKRSIQGIKPKGYLCSKSDHACDDLGHLCGIDSHVCHGVGHVKCPLGYSMVMSLEEFIKLNSDLVNIKQECNTLKEDNTWLKNRVIELEGSR